MHFLMYEKEAILLKTVVVYKTLFPPLNSLLYFKNANNYYRFTLVSWPDFVKSMLIVSALLTELKTATHCMELKPKTMQ